MSAYMSRARCCYYAGHLCRQNSSDSDSGRAHTPARECAWEAFVHAQVCVDVQLSAKVSSEPCR